MIDTDLIKSNSTIANQSLAASQPTEIKGLWRVANFFGAALLTKLCEFVETVDTSVWMPMEHTAIKNRKKITWHADSVIEETYDICNSLTAKIRSICPTAQHYWGISLWRDTKEYFMDWHTDNPDIDMSLQIYLFGGADSPGTIFQQDHQMTTFDFISNTGYAVDQTTNLISHKLAHPVPSDIPRYSLHVVWSRFPKNFSDTH